jgi:hypothetical protein
MSIGRQKQIAMANVSNTNGELVNDPRFLSLERFCPILIREMCRTKMARGLVRGAFRENRLDLSLVGKAVSVHWLRG